MHQSVSCGAQLEPLLVGLPPSGPGAPGQIPQRQLGHLSHSELLLSALLCMLPPAGKGFSQGPIQDTLHAVQHLCSAATDSCE